MDMTERLLTAEQLALFMGVTVGAVRAWTAQGMPCHRLGRRTRFDAAACLAWFEARQAAQKEGR